MYTCVCVFVYVYVGTCVRVVCKCFECKDVCVYLCIRMSVSVRDVSFIFVVFANMRVNMCACVCVSEIWCVCAFKYIGLSAFVCACM